MEAEDIEARIASMEQELKSLREALERRKAEPKEITPAPPSKPQSIVIASPDQTPPVKRKKPPLFRKNVRRLPPPYARPFKCIYFDFYDKRVNLGYSKYANQTCLPELTLLHEIAFNESGKRDPDNPDPDLDPDAGSYDFIWDVRIYEWIYEFVGVCHFAGRKKRLLKYTLLNCYDLPQFPAATPVYGDILACVHSLDEKPYWVTITEPEENKPKPVNEDDYEDDYEDYE